jgi:Uma2 family endonuclease
MGSDQDSCTARISQFLTLWFKCRTAYSVLDIPEYWIVDPLEAKVTRLTLVEGWYDPTEYKRSDHIHSDRFPNLGLTAQQVLNGNVI